MTIKTEVLLFVTLSSFFYFTPSSLAIADTLAKYTCNEIPVSTEPNVNFYEFSIWRDDKTKTLGSGYQKHYVHERYTSGCGYADGKVFLERFRGRVFVFSGFWDHCSEGQILMFNEKNKLLSIISKSSLKVSQNFKCTDQVDNKVPE